MYVTAPFAPVAIAVNVPVAGSVNSVSSTEIENATGVIGVTVTVNFAVLPSSAVSVTTIGSPTSAASVGAAVTVVPLTVTHAVSDDTSATLAVAVAVSPTLTVRAAGVTVISSGAAAPAYVTVH